VAERALSASNDAEKAYKEGLDQRVYPVTSTPENIYAWQQPSLINRWSTDPKGRDAVRYLRYDKHTGYLADIRAAYEGSCEQIDEYRETKEADTLTIVDLEYKLEMVAAYLKDMTERGDGEASNLLDMLDIDEEEDDDR
jgi:hypothetical protein